MTDPTPRASIVHLDELHAKLARLMAEHLRRCRAAGEAPQAAFLAQVRQFLADNGVNTPAAAPRSGWLADQALPDLSAYERDASPPVPSPSAGTE